MRLNFYKPGGVCKAVVPGRSFGSLTVCIAEQRGNYRHYNNYPQRDIPGRPVSRHSRADKVTIKIHTCICGNWGFSPPLLGCHIIKVSRAVLRTSPKLRLDERNHCPQSQENTGERLDLKPALQRDLVPPDQKRKKKRKEKNLPFSLTLFLFPTSVSLSLCPSLLLYLYPSPFAVSPPQTWISRRGVWFFYHVLA